MTHINTVNTISISIWWVGRYSKSRGSDLQSVLIALMSNPCDYYDNHSLDFFSRRLVTACVGVEGFEPPMS